MNTITQTRNDDFGIVDFHSHILPGVDDGAKDLEESVKLLQMEQEQGVGTVVLTPHFYPETMKLDEFIAKRQAAYELLKAEVEKQQLPVRLVLAAEVKLSPKILKMDLRPLCIENTDFLLIEFSLTHYHSWTKNIFYDIQQNGYCPIIAHVERYRTMPEEELFDLVQAGAITQVNTSSVMDHKGYAKIKPLIKQNLIHLIGSDCHNVEKRYPRMQETQAMLTKKWGEDYWVATVEYGNDILNNVMPLTVPPEKRKKFGFF